MTPEERGGHGELEGTARVVLRPIAPTFPLGFVGLAAATFVYAGFQLGWVSEAERDLVGAILLAVPVPLQATGSVLAFLARDGATGTALGLLSVSWLSIGLVLILSPTGSTSDALGLLLLASAAALAASSAVTALSKLVPALVVLLTAVRFALGGVYELGGGEGWQDATAAVGLALAALALYAASANELEDAEGPGVLPLGRRGPGKEALDGSLGDQLRGLEHEGGVRKRL